MTNPDSCLKNDILVVIDYASKEEISTQRNDAYVVIKFIN